MTMKPFTTILFSILFGCISGAHAAFTITQAPACSGAFELLDSTYYQVTCFDDGEGDHDNHNGGSGTCDFGDTAIVKVGVYAANGLPEKADYTARVCFDSSTCQTKFDDEVELCSGDEDGDGKDDDSVITFTPTTWQDCGAAGNYDVTISFQIPESNQDQDSTWISMFTSWFNGQTITLEATLSDDESGTSTTCTMAAQASSGGYQMAYTSMAMIGIILIVTGELAYKNRKRCLCTNEDLDGDEEDVITTNFEMMSEPAGQRGLTMA